MRRLVLPLSLLFIAPANAQTFDFNDAKAPLLAQTYAAPGGVASGTHVSNSNGTLRFDNRAPGSFSTTFSGLGALDVDKIALLQWDFKASPDAKVNWFFRSKNAFYGVRFTGPSRVRPGTTFLGEAAISDLPNGWKRAQIPLRDWIRASNPSAEPITIDEVLVGNWDNEGYLLAGIGGNGAGAWWQIDNLQLLPPDAKSLAPRVGKPRFENNDIVWPLEMGAGLDFQSLALRIDERSWKLNAPELRLQTRRENNLWKHELRFRAGDAGISLQDGASISLQLEGLKDALGRLSTNDSVAEVRFVEAAHNAPVALPRVEIEGVTLPTNGDFETSIEGVEAQSTVVERVRGEAASGDFALRLWNPRTGGPFATSVRFAPVDAAQFPTMTFAYRADDRVRLNWRLRWAGKDYSLAFLDRDGDPNHIGTVANVVADGRWHGASVPLLDLLKKMRPEATEFKIENLVLTDTGWLGNARGVQMGLDDLRFAPRVSGTLKAHVSLRDVSGIRATAWEFDRSEATVPASNASGVLEIPLAGREAGLWWLHVRAQNGMGKWSDAAHFPIVVGED